MAHQALNCTEWIETPYAQDSLNHVCVCVCGLRFFVFIFQQLHVLVILKPSVCQLKNH